jgi:hypothetical protein
MGFLQGGAEQAFRDQVAQAFTSFAIPALLNPFESGLEQAFNLSSFSVDYSPDAPIQVTLSKDLAPRLEATYSRALGSRTPGAVNAIVATPEYTLKLGYRITNRLQMSISTDDQRNNTVALEGVYGW